MPSMIEFRSITKTFAGVTALNDVSLSINAGESHRLLGENGADILISSELPELLNLSTCLIVMRQGKIVGQLSRRELAQERVLRLMAGVSETAA
jgi:ABC-type sugar transport system ATPase subunit